MTGLINKFCGVPVRSSSAKGLTALPPVLAGSVPPKASKRNVRTTGRHIRVGTWNVRTLRQAGKFVNVCREMRRLNCDILGLSEVRFNGSGELNGEGCKLYYSGGTIGQAGVGILVKKEYYNCIQGVWAYSDRVILMKINGKPLSLAVIQVYAPTSDCDEFEIEQFYKDLNSAKKAVKFNEYLIVMGDFNAKIGKGREGDIVGNFGLGMRNERGDRLVEFCEANKLIIGNTWFEHHPRHLYTWISPQDRKEKIVRNQIDFILFQKRFRNSVLQTRTYPGADCGSDHVPVVSEIRIKLKTVKKEKAKRVRWDLDRLKAREGNEFAVETQNRFSALIEEGLEGKGAEEQWTNFKEVIIECGKKHIGSKKNRVKQNWMTEVILQKMDKRRNLQRGSDEYRLLHKEITKDCRQAKKLYFENKCREIEFDQK